MFILDMSFPSYHPMSNLFDNKCSLTWITWYVYHPSKYKEQRETSYFEHRPFAIKFSITYGVKQPLETTGMALSRSHSSARGFFFDWNSATVTTEVFFFVPKQSTANYDLQSVLCSSGFRKRPLILTVIWCKWGAIDISDICTRASKSRVLCIQFWNEWLAVTPHTW